MDELTIEGQHALVRAAQARACYRLGIDPAANGAVLMEPCTREALRALDASLRVRAAAVPRGVVLPFRRPVIREAEAVRSTPGPEIG